MRKFPNLRIRPVVLCIILAGVALVVAGLNIIPDAFATGGAFRYTKHGGGIVDGLPFSGVDRSINPDFTLFYNNNPEAGRYSPGECTHCHEPHASFGAAEPKPDTGGDSGPDPYLAFKEYGTSASYAELCWYCHENMNPGFGGGTGYWKFYQGKSVYQSSSHYNSGNFYWPGTSGDPSSIWPRQSRTGLPMGNKGSCLNCHTPHGIKSSGSATAFDTTSSDGTGGVPAALQTVASGNPSVSADYLIPRQLIAWEETLCEKCHDATGPAINIQGEINKRGQYTGSGTTDPLGGSGHPVDYTILAGRHTADTTVEGTLAVTKHVECYDCHNPHAATGHGSGGTIGASNFNRVAGMSFVKIDGTETDSAQEGREPYVYEVCFRCHSDSWDMVFGGESKLYPTETDRRPPGLSNKRFEFNPNSSSLGTGYGPNQNYNSAYHPVAAAGRNTSPALCLSLQAAFDLDCSTAGAASTALQNLTINCTDCHNSEAVGGAQGTPAGPVTESNLRTTDKMPVYAGLSPVGPHGSKIATPALNFSTTENNDRSILRDYYFTGALPTNAAPFNCPANATEFQNRFKLCFNCHDYRPFYGSTDDTNFYGGDIGNAHSFHLACQPTAGWNPTSEACMSCHYNIHSNVQATNTTYGIGGDGKTHLINFAPGVVTSPSWTNSGSCNLNCHGCVMDYNYTCGHFLSNGVYSGACN